MRRWTVKPPLKIRCKNLNHGIRISRV
jgi:hypothetical protein